VRVSAPALQIVSPELWQAAHDRLEGTRQSYLRGTGGRLWGRPANGIESKDLLSGLAACGWCHGSLEVRSGGGTRGGRRHFYGCTSYQRRGTAVCRNRFELLLSPTEDAVLSAIEREVLDPAVVDLALTEAQALLRQPVALDPSRAEALESELTDLEAGIARAGAGDSHGRDTALADRGAPSGRAPPRRVQQALRPAVQVPDASLERARGLLGDWRGVFRRQVPLARQVLRVLFAGERAVFTPDPERGVVECVAPCTFDRIFTELAGPQTVVTPAGFEPAISTLKGSRPWPD
jgi:hypothetical protein